MDRFCISVTPIAESHHEEIEKIDLPAGGEIQFRRRYLNWNEADLLFQTLMKQMPWKKSELLLNGQLVKTPRLQSWMGDPIVRSGTYSQSRLDWSPELDALRKRLEKLLDKKFDYVLLNLYQDGSDYVGYHADREVYRDEDLIASISLGASRRFLVKPIVGPDEATNGLLEWTLKNGDLLTMNGEMQRHYKHTVPKTSKPVGPRINLTFRQSASLSEQTNVVPE